MLCACKLVGAKRLASGSEIPITHIAVKLAELRPQLYRADKLRAKKSFPTEIRRGGALRSNSRAKTRR